MDVKLLLPFFSFKALYFIDQDLACLHVSFLDPIGSLVDTIAGTSFDAAESGPPPLHSVRCPDHFCLESFPQELKVRRSKMH